jgi:hypothetical protein
MNTNFRSGKKKIAIGFFILSFIFIIPAIVMLLWNAILPEVIHVNTIGYWQAMGIFALSKLLFGGFGMGRRPGFKNQEFRQKWMNMTDEDKEALKSKWREKMQGH